MSNEFGKKKLDLIPLIHTLTIQTKDASTRKFPIYDDFAWAQRDFLQTINRTYNQGKPVRIIVLKARQLGLSTASEGVMFLWDFIHPGTNGLVIAHERDVSSELFEKAQLFWDTWPFKPLYTTKNASARRLAWKETRSSLRIATAKNVRTGRGFTFHAVHASECAYYPDPETLMLGLNQTIPDKHGSIVVMESTANGLGNWFHNQWLDAEVGASDYIPLFYPWWKHPEYKQTTTLSSILELDPTERKLLKLGASYEAVQWRRWAIRNKANNDEEFFMQEYPATPEEAFIATGQNVFPLSKLDECFQELHGHKGMLVGDENGKNPKFVHETSGPLTIFKAPTNKTKRSDRYFIAGDPSQTISGDPACIQVINRQTMEQVAVWHGRIDPINFAREMMLLGYYYHEAELCPEVEGGGQATIATILNSSYPNVWMHRWADKAPGKVALNYGWATNFQRKSWAVSQLKFLIGDNSIILHDKLTYNQMRMYVVLPNGEMGNADPKIHDDSVMALAIGVTASITEGPFAEEGSFKVQGLDGLYEQDAS